MNTNPTIISGDSMSPEFEAWWLTRWHSESAAKPVELAFKEIAWDAWKEAYRQSAKLEHSRHQNVRHSPAND